MCGDGAEDAAALIGGHLGREVGGGFVVRLELMAAPFHEQAVGQAREDPMQPHGVAVSEPALIVAPGDVQPGVQSVFNAPVLPVVLQPAGGGQFRVGRAGDQRHGFGFPPIHFAAQPRGLGHERKAGLLGREAVRADGPGFEAAFVAVVRAGQRR